MSTHAQEQRGKSAAAAGTGAPTTESGGCPVVAKNWGWRHGLRRKFAVRGLDLQIPAGQKVLLLGPSGAGKSTLLHAIAGVVGADEGEAEGTLLVGGRKPLGARGDVGLVMQDPENQIVVGKVGDEVAFGCENLAMPRPKIWQRVRWALKAVGLAELDLTHPTYALSGGQKQRVAIGRALALNPKLMCFDEPTSALDPALTDDVASLIKSLKVKGMSMLIITHDMEFAKKVADRIVSMDQGQTTNEHMYDNAKTGS